MIEWVTACQDGSWDSGVDCQPPSGEVTFQFTVVTEVLQHFASAPCLSGHSQGDSGQTRGGQEVLMQEDIGAGWSGSNLHGETAYLIHEAQCFANSIINDKCNKLCNPR